MGEQVLPSGPSGASGNDGGFSRRPGRFSEGSDHRHHSHRESSAPGGPVTIDQSRLPTCAPFTAFIGNLPFDITEADVRTFFQMRNISAGAILNVKLPRDNSENKSRGFGYVDFATCEDLTRALLVSNQFSIRNRIVRVDLSDSKPQGDRELRPAEANRNWRESSMGVGSAGSSSGFGNRQSQVQREPRPVSVAESSRNWREGAKPVEKSAVFTPREEPTRSSPAAPSSRPFVPQTEPVRNWRESAKPVEKKPMPEKTEPVAPVAPVKKQSTVPTGSWRRTE